MSIRFAAPPHALTCRMAPVLARAFGRVAANDNGKASNQAEIDAALRHFSQHGIAAAQRARIRAEEALLAGDEESYRQWLGICSALDRRMAQELTHGPERPR